MNQNLAKYRNAQRDLEDYEERVELAETQLNKLRAKARSQTTTSTRVSSVLHPDLFSSEDELSDSDALLLPSASMRYTHH